jgi:hypothetical protein
MIKFDLVIASPTYTCANELSLHINIRLRFLLNRTQEIQFFLNDC